VVTPQGQQFPPGDPIAAEDGRITLPADSERPTQEGVAPEGIDELELDDGTLTFVEVDDFLQRSGLRADAADLDPSQRLIRDEGSRQPDQIDGSRAARKHARVSNRPRQRGPAIDTA